MTREEAIKELRGFIGQLTEGCQEAIKVLIPELKESEDEKMIGVIRLALTDVPEERFTTEGTSLSEVLAWLEKQKYDRMKPIYDVRESFESALEKAWNDYHNGYENADKLEDDYVECAHAKGFREGYLFGIEKQKEQKPVENPKKGCPTYPLSVVGDLLAKMPQAPIRFEQEQKPVDWEEDDGKSGRG